MPKYRVEYDSGRTVEVHSDSEENARKHAMHPKVNLAERRNPNSAQAGNGVAGVLVIKDAPQG